MPFISNRTGVADYIVPVTPDDDVNLAGLCVGLYVTTNGAVAMLFDGYESATPLVMTVPDSFVIPAKVVRVRSTGTTATGIFALMVNS